MLARVRLNVRTIITALTLLAICTYVVSHRITQTRAKASQATFSSVNAASFMGPLAPGAIAAGFGVRLATQTMVANTLPLPVNLAGSSVRITDANNVSVQAPLFFVSTGQINYLIPDGVALGTAQVAVTNANGEVSNGTLQIENSSPAIFTFTADGKGVPSAVTTFDGISFDSTVNRDGSARPVSRGSGQILNTVVLFGTAFKRSSNVRVRIAGTEITPAFAGAQGNLVGLDQLNFVLPPNTPAGVVDVSITADGRVSNTTQLLIQPPLFVPVQALTVADVQTVMAQAVGRAQQMGFRATVAVTDREGNVLGIFVMDGAPAMTTIGFFDLTSNPPRQLKPVDPDGLQNVQIPSNLAAISKAGTAAYFSTGNGDPRFGQSAFSTRTASFIIQSNFPPGAKNQMGGPLYNVQFSQMPCSDARRPFLPVGLSGDFGGLPLYKNGVMVGAIGVEGDGFYTVDSNTNDFDQPPEEIVAMAGSRGFTPPPGTTAEFITIDGKALQYANVPQTGSAASTPPFANLPGQVLPNFPIRATPDSQFTPIVLNGKYPGRVMFGRFFPFKDSPSTSPNKLTADDVSRIISQAADQATRLKAGIRVPIGPTEVNITVIDAQGKILGIFSTPDAPQFGFDVSVRKARGAAFFSRADAGASLRALGPQFAKFADAAAADGVNLDGKFLFSTRGVGMLDRPKFPDGIEQSQNGPFSKPIGVWSPFNVGVQLVLDLNFIQSLVGFVVNNPTADVRGVLSGTIPVRLLPGVPSTCTAIPGLEGGTMNFAGGFPLVKNGEFVGAIGISGDGIDQDEMIGLAGAVGFEVPAERRCDQLIVRGARLPWAQLPSLPNR